MTVLSRLTKFLTVIGSTTSATGGATDSKCTKSERNVFALNGVMQIFLSKCLTIGGGRENQSEIGPCIETVLANNLGISVINYECYDCLVEGIDVVNELSLPSQRNACIADLSSDACNLGWTGLVACTGGHNPLKPVVESYCSEANTSEFIRTMVYTQVVNMCLNRYVFGASQYASLLECIAGTMFDAGGDYERDPIDPECLLCWYQLVGAMSILPPVQKTACVSNPTSSDCVKDTLTKDMVLFEKCSGFNPISTDKMYISASESKATANRRLPLWILIAILAYVN